MKLDTAKKLKEVCDKHSVEMPEYEDCVMDKYNNCYNKYDTDELLEWLPASTTIVKKTDIETKKKVRYYVETFTIHGSSWAPEKDDVLGIYADTPSEALALLAIELVERGLLGNTK